MSFIVDHNPDVTDFYGILNPEKMAELSLTDGTIVEIFNQNSRFLVAIHGSDSCKSDQILLNRTLRINADLYIGSVINIRSYPNCKPADCVVFAPIEDTIANINGPFNQLLDPYLENFKGIPILKNFVIPVYAFNRAIEFRAIILSPKNAVQITDPAVVACKNAPIPRFPDSETEEEPDFRFAELCFDDLGGYLSKSDSMIRNALISKESNVFFITAPCGCGKSLFGEILSNETDLFFTMIKGPQILALSTNAAIKRLEKDTNDTIENAPSLLFIDDFDLIAEELIYEVVDENQTEDDSDNETSQHRTRQVTEKKDFAITKCLFDQLNKLKVSQNVIVICTMKNDSFSSAFRQQTVSVDATLPDLAERKSILNAITRKMSFKSIDEKNQIIESIANSTEGKSGAELLQIVEETSLDNLANITENVTEFTFEDFTTKFSIDTEKLSLFNTNSTQKELISDEKVITKENDQIENNDYSYSYDEERYHRRHKKKRRNHDRRRNRNKRNRHHHDYYSDENDSNTNDVENIDIEQNNEEDQPEEALNNEEESQTDKPIESQETDIQPEIKESNKLDTQELNAENAQDSNESNQKEAVEENIKEVNEVKEPETKTSEKESQKKHKSNKPKKEKSSSAQKKKKNPLLDDSYSEEEAENENDKVKPINPFTRKNQAKSNETKPKSSDDSSEEEKDVSIRQQKPNTKLDKTKDKQKINSNESQQKTTPKETDNQTKKKSSPFARHKGNTNQEEESESETEKSQPNVEKSKSHKIKDETTNRKAKETDNQTKKKSSPFTRHKGNTNQEEESESDIEKHQPTENSQKRQIKSKTPFDKHQPTEINEKLADDKQSSKNKEAQLTDNLSPKKKEANEKEPIKKPENALKTNIQSLTESSSSDSDDLQLHTKKKLAAEQIQPSPQQATKNSKKQQPKAFDNPFSEKRAVANLPQRKMSRDDIYRKGKGGIIAGTGIDPFGGIPKMENINAENFKKIHRSQNENETPTGTSMLDSDSDAAPIQNDSDEDEPAPTPTPIQKKEPIPKTETKPSTNENQRPKKATINDDNTASKPKKAMNNDKPKKSVNHEDAATNKKSQNNDKTSAKSKNEGSKGQIKKGTPFGVHVVSVGGPKKTLNIAFSESDSNEEENASDDISPEPSSEEDNE